MSDKDPPDRKKPPPPKRPSTASGQSGTAKEIGAALGGNLDFEPDALLDSLFDEGPAEEAASDTHDDEPTSTGAGETPSREPAGTATSRPSTPAARAPKPPTREPGAAEASGAPAPSGDAGKPVSKPAAPEPRRPPMSRPAPPRPRRPVGAKPTASVPVPPQVGPKLHVPEQRDYPDDEVTITQRFKLEGTAKPPSVNPAGPPPREPFPPAASPAIPPAVPAPKSEDVDWPDLPSVEAEPATAPESSQEPLQAARPPLPRRQPSRPPRAATPVGEGPTGLPPDGDEVGRSRPDSGKTPEPTGAEEPAVPPQESEKPAAAHLTERSALEEWHARAEWLESEAAGSEGDRKARLLAVASELWAMAGNGDRGRAAAIAAMKAAPAMALPQRQSRWLAATDGDWRSVLGSLESESKSAASAEARAHAAFLSAEIHRIVNGDEKAALRKLELSARLKPDDPRAVVFKLATELASGKEPPKLKVTRGGALEHLAEAVEEITRLRAASESTDGQATSAAVSFEVARRALSSGDPTAAGRAVIALTDIDELSRGARWLSAALLAPDAATRPAAVAQLVALMEGGASTEVRRALAARALEQGDAASIERALERSGEDEEPDAFSASDRVALGALTGSDSVSIRPWLAALADDEQLRPLAAAAAAAIADPESPAEVSCGGAEVRGKVELGRALATPGGHERVRQAVQRFEARSEEHPLVSLLSLELALRERSAAGVAKGLREWRRNAEGEAARDGNLAAALAFERAGEADAARSAFAAALSADNSCEAAVRALIESTDPKTAADLLATTGRASGDDTQRSLLLLEAALRRGATADADAFSSLVTEAADAEPRLPFAYGQGELAARVAGNAELLLDWVRKRRDASSDPAEKALDWVREALLVADDDLEAAATLLAEAVQARSDDVALRELHERLSPDELDDRCTWREAVGEATNGPARVRLLLEAALEHERRGDLDSAARAAGAAARDDGTPLARALAERLTASSSEAGRLAADLLTRAKEEEDASEQCELYERLSELDEARGERSSAILWRNAILESVPHHLPSLRFVEQALVSSGRLDDLESVAASLAEALSGPEGAAHAVLAARLRAKRGDWSGALPMVDVAVRSDGPSLWALRQRLAHARSAEDHGTELAITLDLIERLDRPRDVAALSLRAAGIATRLGDLERARDLHEKLAELAPHHVVALQERAEFLAQAGEHAGAAEAYEALAQVSRVDRHRLDAWYRAAECWMDHVGDPERGVLALEQASEIDVTDERVFAKLQTAHVASGDSTKLASLLERRLAETSDPDERIRLEVTRGRALAEVGEREAAKQALSAALDANPDHVDALDAFADVCAAEQDWEGAEQAWIRLARHTQEPEAQAEIYRKLGSLYDSHLPNPRRAELAYKEILKRQPNDYDAKTHLVQVYGRLERAEDAVALQSELVSEATGPEEKRERTVGLGLVYEQIVGDRKKAEATLDRARKAWPHSATVLSALAGFYGRGNETAALHVLLDRAANDARRALNTGRFDPAFFEMLATVGELRGGADAARIANATLAALRGEAVSVQGAGVAAGDAKLDDLLAPDLLGAPLRSLLRKSGSALDAAYPLDLGALRASPMPAEAAGVVGQFRQVAAAFGVNNVDLFVTNALGPVCVPASSSPPQIVFGSALLESDDDLVRSFLFVRAVKILQARAAALSRTAPIDLWPVTAAYLRVFAPDWQPQGVDTRKLAAAEARIKRAMPPRLDDDVAVLALEVTGSIGNRASQLGTAINELGNRTALLAIGDPNAAICAIAFAGGHAQGAPASGVDRLKWIVRNPETRDIAVFSVSDAYTEARRRLGVGG